ncbi:anti-Muellerian hormone type-2 receptor [Hyperolius riggenbachi]|uniref:anti-Muellerian hormone type-2 receptor n=1 Tax=Hyperolius riggenbachi TaxID=752182 RepID=UPI0035A2AAA6
MARGGLPLKMYLITLCVSVRGLHGEGISCALHENVTFTGGIRMAQFGTILEPGRIHCNNSTCCMGNFIIHNGELKPVQLSCYPGHAVCSNEVCVPKYMPKYMQTYYYCLCSSDMCNTNGTFSTQTILLTEEEEAIAPSYSSTNIPGNHMGILMAMIALPIILCVYKLVKSIRKVKELVREEYLLRHQEMSTFETSQPPTLPVERLILLQALRDDGLGAHLWFGKLEGKIVIIKCFPPPLKNLYSQEWKILSLLVPLQHENVMCLLAAGSGTAEVLEHHQLLVLPHYPEGSMRNYLTCRTTDWATACRMAISLAKGLAFLHANIWHEGIYKPAIAHRDLSSENILMTADSSCVISDFGLSVVLGDHRMMKTHDSTVLNMTGTLRYMSPEMLDGSLNLKSWQLALTQADVYSLGLLFWEIFSRCNDLYADLQPPEFSVVFLEELGPSPTLDQLQSLVVEKKWRPQLPKNCNRNLQLYNTLWETLEDCWDPDSEARLTAQCAHQRLCNLVLSPLSLPAVDSLPDSGTI